MASVPKQQLKKFTQKKPPVTPKQPTDSAKTVRELRDRTPAAAKTPVEEPTHAVKNTPLVTSENLQNTFLEACIASVGGSPEPITGGDLICPNCGDKYNHVAPIGRSGFFPYVIESDEYSAWWGRGGLLVIPVECEHCGVWGLAIGFHKGFSTMFAIKDLSSKHRNAGKPLLDYAAKGEINVLRARMRSDAERLKKLQALAQDGAETDDDSYDWGGADPETIGTPYPPQTTD